MFPKSNAGTDESTSSIAQFSEKIRPLENDAVFAIKNDLMVDFQVHNKEHRDYIGASTWHSSCSREIVRRNEMIL